MNTKLRNLMGALLMAVAILLAVVAAPTFAQGGTATLTISKAVDNPNPASGDALVYTIVVSNTSNVTATNVTVIDTLPANVTVTNAGSGTDNGNGTVTWSFAEVISNSTITLNLSAQVDGAAPNGLATNSVEVNADNAALATATADIDVFTAPPAQADLSISKAVSTVGQPGSQVVYTIVVANNGPDTATGVSVADTLPAEIINTSDDGAGAYNTATWSVGEVISGASATLHITGTVDGAVAVGTVVTNNATVSGTETDPNTANDSASASFTVQAPVIATSPVTVTVTNAGGPAAGQLIDVYTIDTTTGITSPTAITGTTNVSGTALFDLADGDYVFIANSGGNLFSSDTCSVPTCSNASLQLFTTVAVSVVDTTGANVANQTVSVIDGNLDTLLTGSTDISGTVSFNLNAGTYSFVADGQLNVTPQLCTTPGCAAVTIVMPVFGVVDVTVSNGFNTVASQQVDVYTVNATTGATTTANISGTTNISGTVSFTLPEGDYQFAATDATTTTYFSDICTVPTCTNRSLLMTVFNPVTVTVKDATDMLLPGQVVYVLDSNATETGITGTTTTSGTVSFSLPTGSYQFAADDASSGRYLSASCTLPGCSEALITLPASAVRLPATTCELVGGVRTCEFWATTGTLNLPDGNSVDIWGYTDVPGGAAQLPGPMIIANQGERVAVTLHNELNEDTSLLFKGLEMVPDMNGVSPAAAKTYEFTANSPGTYLYQAGFTANGNRQVAMGMYGALIVRPTSNGTAITDQIYGDASSSFDDEALVLISEVDPSLNSSPTNFDLREFAPQYWLINGKAYPDTSLIQTLANHKVLLRYLNAGLDYHSMGVLGLSQTLHGVDGNPLPGAHNVVAETLASGQTLDAIVSIPAASEQDTRFALYDTNLLLHNAGNSGFGGMLTFLSILPNGTTRALGGPDTTEVILSPAVTLSGPTDVTITADVNDLNNGGDNIQAVEFFVGTPGANGSGTELTGTFNSPVATASGTFLASDTVTWDKLGSGYHTIYVHAQDDQGNWGPFHPVVLHLDRNGPQTTGLELSPNPIGSHPGGNGEVTLTGTATDRDNGNSNIQAARYTVNGITGQITPNVDEPVASLKAVFSVTGWAEGVYPVSVESQDTLGHWGSPTVINLLVDQTGPDTTLVELLPAANNGTLPVNASLFSMRVNATASDPAGEIQSSIKAVEGFIDYDSAVDGNGTGFPLTPADGRYNSATESAYAFIPLSTVNTLADGVHTIGIHAQDASGNWGDVQLANLIIDRTPPTVDGLTATPNPTAGALNVNLAATATDDATAIWFAEWFVGADPGHGNGTPMAVDANGNLSGIANVAGWADGLYTFSVRARDEAGNWSASATTVVDVGDAPTPEPVDLHFSTAGNVPILNVPAPYDDADVYHWDPVAGGNAFSRLLDASAVGLPTRTDADVDGLAIDGGIYYMSFKINSGTNVPGLGLVQDEDIVLYDPLGDPANPWDWAFVGIDTCLASNVDIDALDVIGDIIYFSTQGNNTIEGVPPGERNDFDDADIYAWNGTACERVFDATAAGLPGGADIDGLTVIDGDTFYMSFDGTTTNLDGLGAVQDEDVILWDAGIPSVFFDGTAHALGADNAYDLDAVDVQ